MPTQRPRHTVTESDEVASALADAARVWPQHARSRSQLLLDLVHAGHQAISDEAETRREARRGALADARAAFTGVYPSGYLDELRRQWPD